MPENVDLNVCKMVWLHYTRRPNKLFTDMTVNVVHTQ